MKTRKDLENEIKRTVGYAEAENKESFMVGFSVTFSRLEEMYIERIESLQKQLKWSNDEKNKYLNDLKTLTSIITKYEDYD